MLFQSIRYSDFKHYLKIRFWLGIPYRGDLLRTEFPSDSFPWPSRHGAVQVNRFRGPYLFLLLQDLSMTWWLAWCVCCLQDQWWHDFFLAAQLSGFWVVFRSWPKELMWRFWKLSLRERLMVWSSFKLVTALWWCIHLIARRTCGRCLRLVRDWVAAHMDSSMWVLM